MMDIEQDYNQPVVQEEKIIMDGIFYMPQPEDNQEVRLILTETHIKIMDEYGRYALQPIQLNFDLSFTANKYVGAQRIYQICLMQYGVTHIFQTLRNTFQWQRMLIKYIKRGQFHELFKGACKVGKGNFASVYKLERISDGKIFAVKAFSKQQTFKVENGKQGLQNEINILRKINHPNICALQGVYQSANSLYIVMEYIDGPNLQKLLNKKQPWKFEKRIKIMGGILSGLAQLSRLNIVHRDLKPQNIMVDSATGQAKIIDFGLSTLTNIQKYLYVRCGTPGFVAPQIINISDTRNARMYSISDVFSAGCIYYNMIFKTQLFNQQTQTSVIKQNRDCNFLIPDFSSNLSVTKQQIFLVKKMLEIDPNERISAQQALQNPPFQQGTQMNDELQDGKKSMAQTNATNFVSSRMSATSNLFSSGISNMQSSEISSMQASGFPAMQSSLARNIHLNKNTGKRIRKYSEQPNKQNQLF